MQSMAADQPAAKKRVDDMISALESAGILKQGHVSAATVQEYALLAIMNTTAQRADLAVVVNCKSEAVCDAGYKSLQKSHAATRVGESSAMKFDITATEPNELSTTVYFDLDGDYLLFSLDEQLLKRLRPNEASNWRTATKSNQSLTRALERLPRRGEAFSLGVVNIADMLGAVPTHDGKPIKSPFQHIVFGSQMSENLHFVATSTVDPAQSESKWFTDMRTADRMQSFSFIPSDAVGAIGLQAAVFHSLHSLLYPYMSPEQQARVAPLDAALKDVVGATLAVRGARGASPFPEIMLAIEAKDAKALEEQVSGAVGALAAGGGLPISPIQSKDLAGHSVRFVSTPLGIGMFLAIKDGKVMVTSTEGFMADVLGGAAPPLQTALSSHSKQIATQGGQLGSVYIDYTKGVSMVEGLQASLAMFTGGAGQIDRSYLEPFRELGSTTAVVYLDNEALMLEAVSERPQG